MKNIRLFIQGKNLNMLQTFSDESYLYNYIVNNYSELAEDNIFRNPTFLKKLEEMIYFSKNNISVWRAVPIKSVGNQPILQKADRFLTNLH